MRNGRSFLLAFPIPIPILILLALSGLTGCNTVAPGDVAVETCWGTLEPQVYQSGFHVNGWCSMQELSIRTQTYTMAGTTPTGGDQGIDGTVQVLAQDQLPVSIDVSVQFHLNGANAREVYQYLGLRYDTDIVHPLVRTAVRDAASEFTAVALVDQRSQLQTRMQTLVTERLQSTLHGRNIPVTAIMIDNILPRNITLPASLQESIANVQRQRQETAQRVQSVLTAQQEAARLHTEADGASQAMLVRARADADAARIRAQAQADANHLLAQSLTPEVLRLRQIEVMSSVLANNSTRVIMIPAGQSPVMMLPSDTSPSSAH
jgi:regulator of protease activity HflC (stomatin/prohibitin superfamily)